MIIGALRDRITIEASKTTADAIGYPAETWSTLAVVWAEVIELNGTEQIENARPVQTKRALIRIRYRDDITVKNRIIARGITYQIESITRVDKARRLEMLEIGVRYDA